MSNPDGVWIHSDELFIIQAIDIIIPSGVWTHQSRATLLMKPALYLQATSHHGWVRDTCLMPLKYDFFFFCLSYPAQILPFWCMFKNRIGFIFSWWRFINASGPHTLAPLQQQQCLRHRRRQSSTVNVENPFRQSGKFEDHRPGHRFTGNVAVLESRIDSASTLDKLACRFLHCCRKS